MSDNDSMGWCTKDLQSMRTKVLEFKAKVWNLFRPHCKPGLNTLKFHLLDHLVDDLERFGTIRVLSASPYENFNLIVKQAYSGTSKRLQTRARDTVQVLETNLKRQKLERTRHVSQANLHSERHGLVRTGERINFQLFLSLHGKDTHNDV